MAKVSACFAGFRNNGVRTRRHHVIRPAGRPDGFMQVHLAWRVHADNRSRQAVNAGPTANTKAIFGARGSSPSILKFAHGGAGRNIAFSSAGFVASHCLTTPIMAGQTFAAIYYALRRVIQTFFFKRTLFKRHHGDRRRNVMG